MINQEKQREFETWKSRVTELLDSVRCSVRSTDDFLLILFLEGIDPLSAAARVAFLAKKMGMLRIEGREEIPFHEGCDMPKGARVRKISKKVGDLKSVGEEGELVGFINHENRTKIYLVCFDGDDFCNGVSRETIEQIN